MSAKPSHLFYQGRERKPVLDQARGVYMWDVDGKRYLDGSSGAMVCNIGHSNENVLEAMRRQMEKSTFGYRLHFETEASEKLASKTAALTPEGLNKVFFGSGGSYSKFKTTSRNVVCAEYHVRQDCRISQGHAGDQRAYGDFFCLGCQCSKHTPAIHPVPQ